MTPNLIPTSRELVRLTREAWKMTKADFGPKLGFTGEFAGQVEHGHRIFSDDDVTTGCASTDPDLRAFWRAYRTARRHEQDSASYEIFAAPQAV